LFLNSNPLSPALSPALAGRGSWWWGQAAPGAVKTGRALHPAGSCDLQLSLFFFKTTPVLKICSSERDGMPLIEAWRLKIIANI